MTNFKINARLGSGSRTVRVSANSVTRERTNPSQPAVPALDSETYEVHFRKPTTGQTECRGMTVSIGNIGNAFVRAPLRLGFLRSESVTAVDGNKISIDMDDGEYRAEALIGADVTVYRITNGVLSVVRKSKVVAANIGRVYLAGDKADAAAGDNDEVYYSQAEGFQWKFGSFFIPNRETWFGIGAVDAGNQYGALGWDSVTPTNTTLPSEPDNTAGATDAGVAITSGGALAAPTVTAALDAGGHRLVNVSWTAVASAVGYVPFYAWQDPATIPAFRHIELENDGGAAVQVGDFYVLRNRLNEPSQAMLSTRAGTTLSVYRAIYGTGVAKELFDGTYTGLTAKFVEFDGDEPAGSLPGIGDTYFEVQTGTNSGDIEIMREQWHDKADQTFYHVLEPGQPYKLDGWFYFDRALSIKIDPTIPGYSSETINLSAGWTRIQRTYYPTAVGSTTSRCYLHIVADGSPATFRFAKFWLGDGRHAPGQWRTELKKHFIRGWGIRNHVWVKPGTKPYWITDAVSAYGTAPEGYGCSLHTYLQNCLDEGMWPHIQLEPILDPEEFDWFIDYMEAPVSSGRPGALRRQALGRAEPWTPAFPQVSFEYGNEPWNGLDTFWNPPGATDAGDATVYAKGDVHGIMFDHMRQVMEANPYWSGKIEWRISGWANNDFGIKSASWFDAPVWVGIANYNGGWEVQDVTPGGDDEVFKRILSRPVFQNEEAVVDLIDRLAVLGKADAEPFIYEGGSGFGDDSGVDLECSQKSIAGAVATLNAFCMQAHYGMRELDWFTGGLGDTYTAASHDVHGGAANPPFQVAQLMFERMGRWRSMRAVVSRDLGSTGYDKQGDLQPMNTSEVYTLRSLAYPGRWWIVAINRDISRSVDLVVKGPPILVESALLYRLTGNPRYHNRYMPGWRLAKNIAVDGPGQTGTTLNVDNVQYRVDIGDTFTINNVAGTYTVTGFAQTGRDAVMTFTPALDSSPADNAKLTFTKEVDGFVPDEFCIPINLRAGTPISPLPDTERIRIADLIGGPLGPGNAVIVEVSGQELIPPVSQAYPGTGILGSAKIGLAAPGFEGLSPGATLLGSSAIGLAAPGSPVVPAAREVKSLAKIGKAPPPSVADLNSPNFISAGYNDQTSTLEAVLDEGGTGYYMIGGASPTNSEVKNGVGGYTSASFPVPGRAQVSVANVPLGPQNVHLVVVDAAGNLSEVETVVLDFPDSSGVRGLVGSSRIGLAPPGVGASAFPGNTLVGSSKIGLAAPPAAGSTTNFTLGPSDADGHTVGEISTFGVGALTQNALLLLVVSDRGGAGHANHAVVDNHSGTWTKVAYVDQNIADANSRHSVSVWAHAVTATDVASGVSITTTANGQATSNLVAQILADAAYGFVFRNFAGAHSNTADWDGVNSGNVAAAFSDSLIVKIASGRQGTAPTDVSVGADAQVANYQGSNQITQILGIMSAGQAAGNYSTTIDDVSAPGGCEGAALTLCFTGN